VRTVYLGTSDFAASVLTRLAESAHRPVLVVSRPDRPRGRGRKLASPPVAVGARELGIEVIQPDSVNGEEARARIEAERPEAVCVCAFGALIKEPLLSDHDMLNVHPSLLPRWRGAAPIERAIEAGDSETGVSIMRPTAELDEGPVHLQRRQPIAAEDDYGALAGRLAVISGHLLLEALDTRPEPKPQPQEGATYAAKIEREERRLDPTLPAEQVARKVRAFSPHIGTYLELSDEERLGVRRVEVESASAVGHDPGEVFAEGGQVLLATGDGALRLVEVQPAGGRAMDAAAWLRGHGDRIRG
jgi:methionyl-tRNA formyltransferase